jgi:hypothetical protein
MILYNYCIGFKTKTTLEEGLKETWDWFLNYKDEFKLRKNYFVGDN